MTTPDRPHTRACAYGADWQRARAVYLRAHPLCRLCATMDPPQVTAATVVDHIKPHKDDLALFWDRENWQPLCKAHHDATKQRQDRRGYLPGCAADGTPLDPAHGWNR